MNESVNSTERESEQAKLLGLMVWGVGEIFGKLQDISKKKKV